MNSEKIDIQYNLFKVIRNALIQAGGDPLTIPLDFVADQAARNYIEKQNISADTRWYEIPRPSPILPTEHNGTYYLRRIDLPGELKIELDDYYVRCWDVIVTIQIAYSSQANTVFIREEAAA